MFGTVDLAMFWILYKEAKKTMDLSQAFKKFDRNGDGTIDLRELKTVVMRYKLPEFTEADIEEMFRVIDANNDGKIVYEGNTSILFL